MVATQTSYTVRPMEREDIPQVSAIDREAFPTQWPPPPFKRDLDSRLVHYLVAIEEPDPSANVEVTEDEAEKGFHKLVSRIASPFGRLLPSGNSNSQRKDNVVGYASMWLMVDEAHLTSIAVKPSHRRQGIGELLLISIIELAMRLKSQIVTLETRVSNYSAQALYRKYGFANAGLRRGYYTDDGEDAVIMSTENIASEQFATMFQRLKLDYFQKRGLPEQIRRR